MDDAVVDACCLINSSSGFMAAAGRRGTRPTFRSSRGCLPTQRGFVFVSTNYRLLPDVEMDVLIRDVAMSLGWVHKHITEHGGDPKRIFDQEKRDDRSLDDLFQAMAQRNGDIAPKPLCNNGLTVFAETVIMAGIGKRNRGTRQIDLSAGTFFRYPSSHLSERL